MAFESNLKLLKTAKIVGKSWGFINIGIPISNIYVVHHDLVKK